jgi:hypothetical protein
MVWATFWAAFSQTHQVALILQRICWQTNNAKVAVPWVAQGSGFNGDFSPIKITARLRYTWNVKLVDIRIEG